MARACGAIDGNREAALAAALLEVPKRAAEVLNHDERLRDLAAELAAARQLVYLYAGFKGGAQGDDLIGKLAHAAASLAMAVSITPPPRHTSP